MSYIRSPADLMTAKPYLPTLVPTSELVQKKIELDFVLPGLLAASVGGVISPGGVGKSFWMVQLGLQLAGAWKPDLVGAPLTQGEVVILSAEDAPDVTTKRIQAMIQQGCVDHGNLDGLKIYSLAGRSLNITLDSCIAELVKACKGARLIVLDTLKRFHSLDENSTQDMSTVMASMEKLAMQTGAAVLFVHHTTKSAVLNGQQGLAQAARGASVLVDNCRWLSFLATMTEAEARTFGIAPDRREQYVRWNIAKLNYGPTQLDRWYVRKEEGVLHPVGLVPAPVRYEMLQKPADIQQPQGPSIREVGMGPRGGLIRPPEDNITPGGGLRGMPTPFQLGSDNPSGSPAVGIRVDPPAAPLVLPSARNVNGGNW